jgi:hypothetical protein
MSDHYIEAAGDVLGLPTFVLKGSILQVSVPQRLMTDRLVE